MNCSFPNIETRPFPGHDYLVGYGGGKVWHLRRDRTVWRMTAQNGPGFKIVHTLAEASEWLAALMEGAS